MKTTVTIPVAIKLSPFFSNFSNMAHRLDEAGADALVLFNRFYQPDIDLEELEIRPNVLLSSPQALAPAADLDRHSLRPGEGRSGGHERGPQAEDVVKLLMVGANVTMMCSSLMRHGDQSPASRRARTARVDGRARIRIGCSKCKAA